LWSALGIGISWFFNLLVYWLSLFFVAPFSNLDILWILIPIWINFIFTEFFQEKKETSLGNAVTNGAVLVWAGVDLIRYLIKVMGTFSGTLVFQFAVCGVIILYGGMIMWKGIKGEKVISVLGRVRETSYVLLVFSPLIYGVVEPSWSYIISVILFAPLFYFIVEWIDMMLPNPKTDDPSKLDNKGF